MRHSGLTSDRGCATNGVAYTCDIAHKGYLTEVCMGLPGCLPRLQLHDRPCWTVSFPMPATLWESRST